MFCHLSVELSGESDNNTCDEESDDGDEESDDGDEESDDGK